MVLMVLPVRRAQSGAIVSAGSGDEVPQAEWREASVGGGGNGGTFGSSFTMALLMCSFALLVCATVILVSRQYRHPLKYPNAAALLLRNDEENGCRQALVQSQGYGKSYGTSCDDEL